MRQAGPNVGPVRWRENFLIISANYQRVVAERVGFEPTVPFQARRISSAVHSTTLPPLRGADIAWSSEGLL